MLKFKFIAALRPQRPSRLLETGSPGRPLTWTFTQLLSSEIQWPKSSVLLYVHRDHKGRGAQDDHLGFFHAANELRVLHLKAGI